MNNNLKSFIDNVGLLCEVWLLTYNKFISQGLNQKDALTHTQGFMTTFIDSMMNYGGGKTNVQ